MSRSVAVAVARLGSTFGGIVVTIASMPATISPWSGANCAERALCWVRLILDLKAIAERQGAGAEIGVELLGL